MKKQLQVLDNYLISWAGWDYKTFTRKTGWGDGLFNEATGYIRPKMATLLSRPYARAVSGTIKSMKYDDNTGYFTLEWSIPKNTPRAVLTEISLGEMWHYPRGYHLEFNQPQRHKSWKKGGVLYISTTSSVKEEYVKLVIIPT